MASMAEDDKQNGPVTASPARVAALIDELRAPDTPTRLNAFRNVQTIASVLGPERTREELVPYLNEFVDEEDDVLNILSVELGEMVELVGGSAHAHVLLVPLETLCAVEENAVREKALASMTHVLFSLPPEALVHHALGVIGRLATNEWFTSRVAAAALAVAVYPRVSQPIRGELRVLFTKMSTDETPMVRRSTCILLAKFAPIVAEEDKSLVRNELLPLLEALIRDDQDSVRLYAVDACISFSKCLDSKEDQTTRLLPLVVRLAQDKSWRVRFVVADKFCELLTAVGFVEEGKETKADDLVDTYIHLLQDPEAEVRTSAGNRLGEVAKMLGLPRTLKKLLGPMRMLTRDPSHYSRAALASSITSLSHVITSQDQFVQEVLPSILALLRDPHPEVRLNVISRLENIQQIVGLEVLHQCLLPAITDLASDKKWRVRLSIIYHLPMLAKQLGVKYFEAKLADLSMQWLGDSVYSIRDAATGNLTRLADAFGPEWATQQLVPKVITLIAHKSYLFRMTALNAMGDLARVLGTEVTSQRLYPPCAVLTADPVANVRFTAARTIGRLLPWLTPQLRSQEALPLLTKLAATDDDPDVKGYAREALQMPVTPLPIEQVVAAETARQARLGIGPTALAQLSLALQQAFERAPKVDPNAGSQNAPAAAAGAAQPAGNAASAGGAAKAAGAS